MRLNNLAFVAAVLVLATFLLVPAAQADQAHWVIIGDSWGDLIESTQRDKIAESGLDWSVTGLAVGGTTARQWAADENGLLSSATSLLESLPANEPALVYVSIGGNDFLGEYAEVGDAIFERIDEDLAFVAHALVSAKPNTAVLLGGYDLLNFEQSAFCEAFAVSVVGSSDPEAMNALLVRGAEGLDELAASNAQYLSMSVLGSLQGSPGSPDLTGWSPAQYITFDCIHLTPAGYEIFNDDVFRKLRFLVGSRG